MFQVNEYKIVFKRVWHTDDDDGCCYDGRYDTKCEIYTPDTTVVVNGNPAKFIHCKEPSFTGIAKLHPNDKPDKIVGKKIALRKAICRETTRLIGDRRISDYEFNCADFYNKSVRTAIWKAFWKWVESWVDQANEALGMR